MAELLKVYLFKLEKCFKSLSYVKKALLKSKLTPLCISRMGTECTTVGSRTVVYLNIKQVKTGKNIPV